MENKRMRVLFVDDEESNLKAFKTTFRRDMDVLLANSGDEALRLLESDPVHVIISDQRMPGMSGSEFLAIAKERFPKSMRMLLTGYADLEAVVAAVNEGGIHAYATKPWDANDLKLRIEQVYGTQQLREEKDRLLGQYRQVFDASGDPIAIVDRSGRVIEANDACRRLLGTGHEEILAKGFIPHLEDPGGLVRTLVRHRSGNSFANVDLTLRNASGNLVDCLVTATYLGKREDGQEAFQVIIKDVTDRKQEEKSLRKLNADLDRRVAVRTAQLLEALEDLGSFSYTVAHDLRSPLKNIAALGEHLRAHAEERQDGEARDFTERISKSTQRLIDLVDDLLRFSQTNTRELDRKQVELAPLAQSVIDEQVSDERRGQVTIDIATGTAVLADAPMLKVVLHNLLSNALKFTRTVEAPTVVISHRREGEMDIVEVRDNGVGFDPKHKDQAFGVFKRLHNTGQFEGTGVGLAIVQRIMAKHGGEVSADSAVDQGTTIRLALPATERQDKRQPFARVA